MQSQWLSMAGELKIIFVNTKKIGNRPQKTIRFLCRLAAKARNKIRSFDMNNMQADVGLTTLKEELRHGISFGIHSLGIYSLFRSPKDT